MNMEREATPTTMMQANCSSVSFFPEDEVTDAASMLRDETMRRGQKGVDGLKDPHSSCEVSAQRLHTNTRRR